MWCTLMLMCRYFLPFFLGGIGSAAEVYPVPILSPIHRPFSGLTDAQLLASDWYRVGHALYSAMHSIRRENASVQEAGADR